MRFGQTEVIDYIARDGEIAVMIASSREVIRLGQLGSALYELCATPTDLAILASELERVFGPPAEMSSVDATQTAVADMVSAGVLEQVED